MTEQPNSAERDNVLFAFQRACPRPTASDVTTWCSRYEEFAEDIIEHAAIMRDLDAQQCDDNEEIDPSYSRVDAATSNTRSTRHDPVLPSSKRHQTPRLTN